MNWIGMATNMNGKYDTEWQETESEREISRKKAAPTQNSRLFDAILLGSLNRCGFVAVLFVIYFRRWFFVVKRL